MTELQRRELGLLQAVEAVCEKLGIRYYLVCGSALGAVKYGGFIPWDDDLDIAMERPAYEKFIREGQGLLPAGLFLQNYHTDPAFPQIFTKIRDTRTTYIESSAAHLPICHGVFLDVFPIDGYPADRRRAEKLERRKRVYRLAAACAFRFPCSRRARIFFGLERLLGLHKRTRRIMEKYDAMISAYGPEESALWCNHGNWQGRLDRAPREQYGRGQAATFEGMTVYLPSRYEEYLTQKYGDWRRELPREQQVGHHYATVVDLERPYWVYTGKRGGDAVDRGGEAKR